MLIKLQQIIVKNISSYRASCSENYRQLQLLRGVRGVQETEEERRERDATRSEAKVCPLHRHWRQTREHLFWL